VHANRERILRRGLDGLASASKGADLSTIVLAEAVIDHHRSWAARYQHASRRPWESIPAEAPAPTWETHKRVLAPLVVARVIATEAEGLSLPDAGVSDDLMDRIGRCRRLRWLNLSGNPITDAGLVHLGRLTNLEGLDLEGTRVTDVGLVHLAALSGLRKLDLYRTRVTKTGLRDLASSLPRTVMTYDPRFDADGVAARLLGPTADDGLRAFVEFPPTRVLKVGSPVGSAEVRVRVR
jgi:Leucine rich repeat